jgi:hypothetical protein
MYALLYAFPSGRYVVMMDNFENVIDPETREIEDAELREALGALLEYPQHEVKVVVTTRFASHDLPLVRPELQTRLELDKGLASPYAENILCVIPSRLRCGYQLRQQLLPLLLALLQGRCALAPAPRARPHPGSPLGAPRLPASRALPPVGNIGATARRSEEFPDQLAHISQFLSYGAVLVTVLLTLARRSLSMILVVVVDHLWHEDRRSRAAQRRAGSPLSAGRLTAHTPSPTQPQQRSVPAPWPQQP